MGSTIIKTVSVPISEIDVTAFQNMEEAVSSVFTPENKVIPGFALAMNAEKVMSARSNPMFEKVLKLATLRYTDGIGVVLALRRKGIVSTKIAGCELWEQIMAKAGKNGTRVFLIGARSFVLETVDLAEIYALKCTEYYRIITEGNSRRKIYTHLSQRNQA